MKLGVAVALLPLAVVVALPFKQNEEVTYSDALARKQMLAMSAAAYTDNPQLCMSTIWPGGAKLRRVLRVHCDVTRSDYCTGFTGVSTAEQAILLSFRGTDNNVQLIMESLETIFTWHSPWIGGGNISAYFNDGIMNLWNQGIKDDLLTLKSQYPGYKLWITGHSLGGALASLAASLVQVQGLYPKDQVQLYTFGQPRIGDSLYASSHDKMVANSYRVTHAHDPVPHLPLLHMEGYQHHKSEVYYHEDMAPGAKYRVCQDADESTLCSNGNLMPDASVKDHNHYFTVDVSAFGFAACKA